MTRTSHSSLCGVWLFLRDTWDPFQLNPIGAEKEEKRRCFLVAQYLVAVIVGLAVLTSAVISKVHCTRSWEQEDVHFPLNA